MIRRSRFALFVCVPLLLAFLLVASLVLAAETAADFDNFAKNPTLEQFMKLKKPTVADFSKLYRAKQAAPEAFRKLELQQQALFLKETYDEALAADFVGRASFSGVGLSDQQAVALKFFSKNPAQVNQNQNPFVRYLASRGVTLVMEGAVKEYAATGVLQAENGGVNLHELKDAYSFHVGADNKIYLIKKDSLQHERHSFTGTLLSGGKGKLTLLRGSFDGFEVDHASDIVVTKQDRVLMRTETIGPFHFATPTAVGFSKAARGEPALVSIAQNARMGSHVISGVFSLRGSTLDDVYVEPNREGYVDGYSIRGKSGKVHVRFSKRDDEPIMGEKRNQVYFGAKEILMSSAGMDAYELELDTGALIAGGRKSPLLSTRPLLELPSGGYKPGDAFAGDSSDVVNLLVIQGIVGAPPNKKFTGELRDKIIAWQNSYNQRHGLEHGDTGWLKPTGRWTDAENEAYQVESSSFSRFLFKANGGSGGIVVGKQGLDITIKGDMDVVTGSETYTARDGKVTRHKSFPTSAGLPFTLTAYDERGTVLAKIKREAGERDTSSVLLANRGFVSGELCLPCFMRDAMDLSQVNCAKFARILSRLEGGYYTFYDGKTFDFYTGRHGSAWEFADNMQKRGGASLFWKEAAYGGDLPFKDPRLAEQVAYDFGNFKEGDVIAMYYTGSDFLTEAWKEGKDGRQNTHVARVIGTEQEVFSLDANADLSAFLKQRLDVTNSVQLGNYPVWVKPADAGDGAFVRVTLGKDGRYYGENGKPFVPSKNTDVMVKKVVVAHQISHGASGQDVETIRMEDLGHFFSDNPRFSLYEHLRPNEEYMAEAKKKQEGLALAQVSQQNLRDHLAALEVPERDIPLFERKIKAVNPAFAAAEIPQQSDILIVSRTSPYLEETPVAERSVEENMGRIYGAQEPAEWRARIADSTIARLREYNLPESDAESFELLTLSVGLKESSLHDGYRSYYALKKQAEDAAARSLGELASVVTPVDSFGYFQLDPHLAENNAKELAYEGVITTPDYQGVSELVSKEGSVKHGQRQLAKIWKRYVTPELRDDEKIKLVAAAYNCGEWCPRNAALQKQVNDLISAERRETDVRLLAADGKIGETTLGAFESYAQQNNIPFAADDLEAASTTADFEKTQFYQRIKADWQKKFGRPPAYAQMPQWKYGDHVLRTCRKIAVQC